MLSCEGGLRLGKYGCLWCTGRAPVLLESSPERSSIPIPPSRALLPSPDIRLLILKGKKEWLSTSEILCFLKNFQNSHFPLTTSLPIKPESGSIFVYNKIKTRSFRNDGHNWQKKSDNKTVDETHTDLKTEGGKFVSCYYAYLESDDTFQRRSYWIKASSKPPGLEKFVLVHYLRSGRSRRSQLRKNMPDPPQVSFSPLVTQPDAPISILEENLRRNAIVVRSSGGKPTSEEIGKDIEMDTENNKSSRLKLLEGNHLALKTLVYTPEDYTIMDTGKDIGKNTEKDTEKDIEKDIEMETEEDKSGSEHNLVTANLLASMSGQESRKTNRVWIV